MLASAVICHTMSCDVCLLQPTSLKYIRCGSYHNMEDYTNIIKLEELTIKYQKKAESSRNWVHHLQVTCYYFS
ncbi:hypothetical protein EB796_010831 [Bugula neritina]|uniref:Uncharacterized protein n=1 Tax=Bugula neritina TaxID=10212 RepID=A0A7J7JZV7_BUGNE|nr:hypothetical protein EB796_010831 [Bugula neritina]